jgi:hypothetical protein
MDSTVVIEIAEAGITALDATGALIEVPAVALLEPDGLVAGRAAAASARLKPVLANDRFLAELSLLPLPAPHARARHTADLAHAAVGALLDALGTAPATALAAVPSQWRGAQVGLFAAIARAAGLPLGGFIDAAVAATAALPAARVLYLDVDLHQSRLVVLGGDMARRREQVEVAPRVGGKALATAWAQFFAESFVRRTRFDPLHDGASEQRLYDALPGWLARLAESSTLDVELDHGGGAVAVGVTRDQLLLATEAYYSQLVELVARAHRAGEAAVLALSGRAAALPGLAARFGARRGLEVVALPPAAAPAGAAAAASAILAAGPEVVCLSLWRGAAPPAETAAPDERSIAATPTHLLHAGRAYAIGAEPLVLGRAPQAARAVAVQGPPEGVSARHCSLQRDGDDVVVVDHSRYGTFLNDARVRGRARLAAGDRLRLGVPGVVFELVAIASA